MIAGLKKVPVLGILRDITASDVEPIFQASFDAGLRVIEIALNTPDAISLIKSATATFGSKMDIGAGTVLSVNDAEQAIAAGATFLVTPNLNLEVAHYCNKHKIPYIPGALTPSEIYEAWIASEYMVKVFPASVVGPKYFKDIKGPFKDIQIMAVGGVTAENMKDFFDNGAVAVSCGGVYKKEWVKNKDWNKLKDAIAEYVKVTKQLTL